VTDAEPPRVIPTVYGFIAARVGHFSKNGKPLPKVPDDLIAVWYGEDGVRLGQHIGQSRKTIDEAFEKVWRLEAEQHYPEGFVVVWVDEPKTDPRIAKLDLAIKARPDESAMQEPGDQYPDADGNRDGVEHLYDALGTEVVPGLVSWVPKDGKMKEHVHPASRIINGLTVRVNFGRGPQRGGDPSIMGTEKMADHWTET
jgi:hypothetical protein